MSPANPLKRTSAHLDTPTEPVSKHPHYDTPAPSPAQDNSDNSTTSEVTTPALSPAPIVEDSTDAESTDMSSVPKVTRVGQLLVKKLSDKARLPTRGSKYAAGFDLYSAESTSIPARSRAVIKTDLSIAVPEGTYGRVAPRSGLAVKHFIDTGAGVVDYDYRGQLGVVLFNFGEKEFMIAEGDRIAQLVLEKIVMCDAVEVDDLDDTERGAGGFGSTGVKL